MYQYSDEVLHFAGGRLLLRGVNGSGKSTAMNMLLPFLLTTRERGIDAAGDQSGILKSWMLDGRDDAQPVGYLWIEFERRGEFLVCGCGIKANRRADTVNTWWFITSKRPGVDLDLVAGGVALSSEALRAAIDGDEVFGRARRVTVPAGTPVLVVENPRLVEASAERRLRCGVVATNGNPATAVTALLRQLLDSGASAWYHGDFDAAGIAICRRMHQLGCKPWMMGASNYTAAVRLAEDDGVLLEPSTKKCGPTPWDPKLEATFDDRRLIIHEEFVLDSVLGAFSHMASPDRRSAPG